MLPLTLAILDGMSVRVGAETFILPLNCVMESLQPKADDVRTAANTERVMHVRGEYLPLLELHRVFDVADAVREPTQGIAVILQAEGKRFALLVDQLIGQHRVVLKNLETNYRKVPCISAATILGDGSVALIVDGCCSVPACAGTMRWWCSNRSSSGSGGTNIMAGIGHIDAPAARLPGRNSGVHAGIGGVRHRHPQGAGDPRLRRGHPHRQCAGFHQGRDQPARRDRADRRPAGEVPPWHVRYDHQTVVIILNIAGRVVGIVVDGVSDVLTLNGGDVKPAPEFGVSVSTEYLTGLGSVEGRMLILIDIERLMTSPEMELIEVALA